MAESYVKPTIKPVDAFGRQCLQHPSDAIPDACMAWHRFTIACVRSGQSRPYGDTVCMYDVCFEGGAATTKGGIDSPFFVHPHEQRVREFALWLTGAKKEPGPFDTQLTQCEKIEETPRHSVWRISAVTPYCD